MDYRHIPQSTGWLYFILIPVVHVVYRLLFRKIYLHNRKGVKAKTPVLIAANHPTAFIDPIFFCIFFDPPVYNMTRGDIFRKPLFRRLMESVNMFPVFRRRDGFDGRDRNDEVFEYCAKKLKAGVAVNIFVEGEHHLDKRVLPAQKGIARIAFGTYERHSLDDLQIVPVGCNYIYGDQTRDEAKVLVGPPIFVKDYWSAYEQNPGAATIALCKDIEAALKKLCYHIEDRNDDDLAEQLLLLWRNDHPATHLPVLEHRADRFLGEKVLINRLNALNQAEKQQLRTLCNSYFSSLKKAGLSDEGLVSPNHGGIKWLIFLVVAAPLALVGYLIGLPVRVASFWTAGKVVKKREFYTSVLMGVALIFGLLYFLTLLGTGLILNRPWIVTLALLMPILAWISVFWREVLNRLLAAKKAAANPEKNRYFTERDEIWN